MKKTLIILLSVLTLVFMASSVLAADLNASGKVEVKWAGSSADGDEAKFQGEKQEATLEMDVTKEYDDVASAGLKIKAKLHEDEILKIDGDGWIKLDYDLYVVTAKTGIDGSASKDLGEYELTKAAGVQVDVNAIEGLTLTGLINGGSKYNFLAKAEYSADALTIGGGIQKNGEDGGNDAMGVWGSYEIMEGLTASAEYASRTVSGSDAEAKTAILVKGAYAADALTVDAAFMTQDESVVTTDNDDKWKARDYFQSKEDWAFNPEGSIVYVDASYALTDDLKVNGSLDYILSAETDGVDYFIANEDAQMSYKVGANYTLTEKIGLEGWFKGYNKGTQFGGKGVYTFADGLTGTLEVTNGKDPGSAEEADSVTAYSVVLSASL